jgi:putative membrane protein
MGSLLGWHPHPDVWLLVAALGAGYLGALRRLGARYVEPGEKPVTGGQVAWFLGGVAAIWAAADWPVHEVAERSMYSVHMLQHLLLTLAGPPMLLLGTPDWLARRLLRPISPLVRSLTRPFAALLIFNGVLVLSHWPLVVEAGIRSEPIHLVTHAALVLSALVMWWPVLSPLPEIPRLPYPAQMLYLFLQTVVPTVPASFLTFAHSPLYGIYESFPRPWGLSAVEDQRIGGLLMKIGGGFMLWSVIAVLFFRWSAKEERPEKPDVLEWQAVERELNRAGSRG